MNFIGAKTQKKTKIILTDAWKTYGHAVKYLNRKNLRLIESKWRMC